jgi:hypothetical protein
VGRDHDALALLVKVITIGRAVVNEPLVGLLKVFDWALEADVVGGRSDAEVGEQPLERLEHGLKPYTVVGASHGVALS